MKQFSDMMWAGLTKTFFLQRHPIFYIGLCLLLILTPLGFLGVFCLLHTLEALDNTRSRTNG